MIVLLFKLCFKNCWYLYVITFVVFLFVNSLLAQIPVDLSDDPNASYLSDDIRRDGAICGARHPDKCVEFIITLHPNAGTVLFDIVGGSIPPGAMTYQIDCGEEIPVGDPIPLIPPGPYRITFCKPGNNSNIYAINTFLNSEIDLSIGLISYNISCNNDIVSIMWIMSSEINIHYYSIEMSIDGLNWEKIDNIYTYGITNNYKEYLYNYKKEFDSDVYIRLIKYNIKDESCDLFVKKLICSEMNIDGVSSVWFNDSGALCFSLNSSEAQKLSYKIVNILGQIIEEQNIILEKGYNYFERESIICNKNSMYIMSFESSRIMYIHKLIPK